MKLKKIASLMLAGIMAVSMLAGCGEGKDNGGNAGSSSSQPTSTGLSAEVVNMSSLKSLKNVSAKDSAMLQKAVTEAAAIRPDSSSNFNDTTLTPFGSVSNSSIIKKAIVNAMGNAEYVTDNGGTGWDAVQCKADNDGNTAYDVYYISAKLSDNEIKQIVADNLDTIVGTLDMKNLKNGDTYTYDVSVAMADWVVGKDADASKDAVIVAIAFTLHYNEVEFN